MQTWNTCANASVIRIAREQKYWLEREDRNALVWTVIDSGGADVGGKKMKDRELKKSLFLQKAEVAPKPESQQSQGGSYLQPQNKALHCFIAQWVLKLQQNLRNANVQTFIRGQDHSSLESKSGAVDEEPGPSASNRKPQLCLSDTPDADTEQSIQRVP